jgi:signal transduction histidine kinase
VRAFRDLSIRYKLTLLLLGVVAVVLLAVSAANIINVIQFTGSTLAAKYSTLAKIVAAESGAALSIADVDPRGAQQIVSDLAIEPSIRFAALLDTAGKEVVRYPADAPNLQPPKTLGAAYTRDGFLDVAEQVKLNDGTVIGRIFIRADTQELRIRILRNIVISVAVFLIALVLALLLSIVLQRFISQPILQLAHLTQRVSTEHDYSLRAEKRGNDELGALCDGFNSMLTEIRRRDAELEQHRARLEVAVEQRTKVLQARTEELTNSNVELARSREALQTANKELEAFSYSISHDLRAPLRAIDGFSRILLDEYAAALPADAQEYLRDVRSSTQQMGYLVDDLLTFSRLSRQPIKQQPVASGRIVSQCLEELHNERDGRRVEILVGELPACSGDAGLLKQVWVNLLSNALKYTGRREAAVIEVGSRNGDESGQTTYFVKDNGVGFDMRYVHKLFGVFQRLHRAEDYAGTGVGLAIVQRIVHRHGGRVWAESQPDLGATFYFTLPSNGAQHG